QTGSAATFAGDLKDNTRDFAIAELDPLLVINKDAFLLERLNDAASACFGLGDVHSRDVVGEEIHDTSSNHLFSEVEFLASQFLQPACNATKGPWSITAGKVAGRELGWVKLATAFGNRRKVLQCNQ